VPSRSVNGNRYQLDTRAESPRHTPTPPRSPMKALPNARDPITRVASSQKYTKASVSRSPLPSPHLGQRRMEYGNPNSRNDSTLRASPVLIPPPSTSEPSGPSKSQKPSLTTKLSQTFRPAVRSPEPAGSAKHPEPGKSRMDMFTRPVKSPEPGRTPQNQEPASPGIIPESARPARYQNLGVAVESPGSTRMMHIPSPMAGDYQIQELEAIESRAHTPDRVPPLGIPREPMAKISTVSKPPIPERAPSRRRSLTERTRDLVRKKPSFARENDEKSLSNGSLPIQSPSAEHTPAKQPASPVRTSVVRRTSYRNGKNLSMSTYSQSPTSPTKPPSETPPLREASPIYIRNGKPVPTQSSYAALSLEPMQPMSPLEHPALALDAAKTQPPDLPVKKSEAQAQAPTSIIKNKAVLDDTEGSVNANHPLVQTARHTRFARNANGDLPLRHYHSQGALTHSNPDLTHRSSDDTVPPKRSSSLLYDPRRRFLTSPEPSKSRSPTPNEVPVHTQQSASYEETANPSSTNIMNRANTAPAESELGIHPAHRTPELAPEPSAASPPIPTSSPDSFATECGATPPPIATARSPQSNKATPRAKSPTLSPPSRIAPLAPSEPQKQPQVTTEAVDEHDWQPQHQAQHSIDSAISTSTPTHTKNKPSATTKAPFYLKPASSAALIDFLATTPPPSPPHPGTRLDTNSPTLRSPNTTGTLVNQSFVTSPYPQDAESSPPPPAPGSRSMTALGRVTSGEKDCEQAKKGWRKMFGTGRSTKKMSSKSVNGKNKKGNKRDDANHVTAPRSTNGTGEGDGFVGLGKDGVWISRKNFTRD